MKALVKYDKGIGKIEIRDVPVPAIKQNEVLVRVDSCGICGTDIKLYDEQFISSPPVTLGHEFSGVIEEAGSSAAPWKKGDRVVAEQHFKSCGKCGYCLTGRRHFCASKRSPGYLSDGAFTEYIAVDSSLLHKVPAGLSLEAAALVEPMAIAACAVLGKAGLKPGEDVVILGSGSISLLALQLVRAAGAGRVIVTGLDADEDLRFDYARRFGADLTVNVQKDDPAAAVMDYTGGRGADLVIDLSGAAAAILSGFSMLKKDGRFCAVGLPHESINLPWEELVLSAQTVFFSYSSDYTAWERCLGFLSRGEVRTEGFLDNIYPLDRWLDAFERARSGKALKVIIKPFAGEELK